MVKKNANVQRSRRPSTILSLPIDPKLKTLIHQAASSEGLPMNEWVARVAANELGKPELAAVPRKKFGRPAKV